MRCTDWNNFKSLEDVKKSLQSFIYNKYINNVHSSTGETPNIRWHNEYSYVTLLDEKFIDESFLHKIERKVRKDRCVKIENKYYEVPNKYVNQTINIRYDPNNLEEIFIFENNEKKETCKIVDKISNSKIKRKNNIDYSKAINDERDVIEMDDK